MTTYTSRSSHHVSHYSYSDETIHSMLLQCLKHSFISRGKNTYHIVECWNFRGQTKFDTILKAFESVIIQL